MSRFAVWRKYWIQFSSKLWSLKEGSQIVKLKIKGPTKSWKWQLFYNNETIIVENKFTLLTHPLLSKVSISFTFIIHNSHLILFIIIILTLCDIKHHFQRIFNNIFIIFRFSSISSFHSYIFLFLFFFFWIYLFSDLIYGFKFRLQTKCIIV